MDERARFETALRLVDDLAERNRATPILVEGQRDVSALRALGCAGEILPLKSGEPLRDLAHALALAHREVILLPDWDRSGLELRDAAHAQLHAHGLRCDLTFHRRLVRDTELTLKDVETLAIILARGLRKFRRMSLDEHTRALAGDPLGVATLHEEFAPVPHAPRAPSIRGPKPKRRARRRE